MLKYAKEYYQPNFLKILYLGKGKPHFRYWGSFGVTNRKTLEQLQHKAMHIFEMFRQESASMVYKVINANAPLYLTEQFISLFFSKSNFTWL